MADNNKKIRIGLVVISLMLLAFFRLPAAEAADTANGMSGRVDVTLQIPVMQLVTPESPVINLGNIGMEEMLKGYKEVTKAVQITVKSNVPWILTLRSDSPNLGSIEKNTKSLPDFQWRISGTGAYQSISNGENEIKGWGPGVTELSLDLKLMVNWRDHPGSYGLNLSYTISGH